jgi:hypothetical protein
MHALDTSKARDVIDALRAGADACRSADCRQGSIDVIEAPGHLIATGDTHDHPKNYRAVLDAAGLGDAFTLDESHLTLHEIIHPDTIGMDPAQTAIDRSVRGLARVAALKAEHPELVHVLLANHELAQATEQLIVKNGVRCVDAFNKGIAALYPDEVEDVKDAVRAFIFAMPIALRARCPQGDILCTHSLPSPELMGRFDTSILSRELTMDDYQSRTGSAHIMTWGRGYDAELLEDLTESWGVNLFILGHEHVPGGSRVVEPNAIILNTDHDKGVYLPIDLDHEPTARECASRVVRIDPLAI